MTAQLHSMLQFPVADSPAQIRLTLGGTSRLLRNLQSELACLIPNRRALASGLFKRLVQLLALLCT